VDVIEGLSPAIAIEQRPPPATTLVRTWEPSPKSTTTSLLSRVWVFRIARMRQRDSPNRPNKLFKEWLRSKGNASDGALALVRGRKGTYTEPFKRYEQKDYVRVRVNGKFTDWKKKSAGPIRKHDIELVVDRIEVNESNRERLADSIETALKEGRGLVMVTFRKKVFGFSVSITLVPNGGLSLPELNPDLFFQQSYGACADCTAWESKSKSPKRWSILDPTNLSMTGFCRPGRTPRHNSQRTGEKQSCAS